MERCLSIAVPSWLAAGNLPDVARRRRLTVRFVTLQEDVPIIEAAPAYRRIAELAEVSFLPMDDLQSQASTYVTLTLAYHRGLVDVARAGGPQMALFLNSDFILGRESLNSLCDVLDAGAQVVLAPSLRAVEEEIFPMLGAARQSPAELSLSSRELVAMAFQALHPTVLCARMDQDLIRSRGAHQYFWRPEPDTLVGRGFCLFPLALRVEGPLPPAESFCDYGLVPLLAPGVAPTILNDSDRFFALELAPLQHEADFFQVQSPELADVAKLVGQWSLQFHRDQASTPLFYRAGDPGPSVAEAVQASQKVVDRIRANLSPPAPVRNHPVWLSAVHAWRTDRAERGVLDLPAELGPTPERPPRAPPGRIRRWARTLLAGRPGQSWPWQPRWLLSQVLESAQAAGRARNLRRYMVGHSLFEEIYVADAEEDHRPPAGPVAVLMGVRANRPDKRRELIAVAEEPMAQAQTAAVLVLSEEAGGVDKDSLTAIFSWLAGSMDVGRVHQLDLRLDDWARFTHGRLADNFTTASPGRKGILVFASAAALAAILGRNLLWALRLWTARPTHVSAIVLEGVRRAG